MGRVEQRGPGKRVTAALWMLWGSGAAPLPRKCYWRSWWPAHSNHSVLPEEHPPPGGAPGPEQDPDSTEPMKMKRLRSLPAVLPEREEELKVPESWGSPSAP